MDEYRQYFNDWYYTKIQSKPVKYDIVKIFPAEHSVNDLSKSHISKCPCKLIKLPVEILNKLNFVKFKRDILLLYGYVK